MKYWCIGNEMDGPWQIGHLEALEYGAKAREAAKMMRWHDPSVELIVCGSSNSAMPTYPAWDRVVLEQSWDQVNYHSMHYYAMNEAQDTDSFLSLSAEFESFVDTLSGVLRYVKAQNRSKHDVYLSWDEWNVWYKARGLHDVNGSWTSPAPDRRSLQPGRCAGRCPVDERFPAQVGRTQNRVSGAGRHVIARS